MPPRDPCGLRIRNRIFQCASYLLLVILGSMFGITIAKHWELIQKGGEKLKELLVILCFGENHSNRVQQIRMVISKKRVDEFTQKLYSPESPDKCKYFV